MSNILNFEWYAPRVLKINTKTTGLRPLKLRKIQLRYVRHLRDDFPDGIIRSISLKPRQAGWSTLIAGINTHFMATRFHQRGIMLADKFARTSEVHGIYSTFVNNIPLPIRPMIAKNNSDEILFDNPNEHERIARPGLGSGFKSETAQDPNAGRSGTRKWAHLTEYAFYPYAESVDEGVQNSIPLARGTRIFKESTAYGMSGVGESFYSQWEAATRGDSIYKPFFVAWYEVDDYVLPVPPGFILTKEEVDLLKKCPDITNENLAWRRMKIREYSGSSTSIFSPEERFKQDFPSYPEEAFLATGRPVFDQVKLRDHIKALRETPAPLAHVAIKREWLSMYAQMVTVFFVPEKGGKYTIGADVAEGVESGDFSNAYVRCANTGRQMAVFHGHLDPDHFGNALVDLAKVYNDALLVPEMNNMGHTTLQAIKDRGYLKVYMRAVYDELDQSKETLKMGWRTTAKNKQQLLSRLIAEYRDGDVQILDIELLREMMSLTRESDGGVELTGKDRVVAACLAGMGIDQIYEAATVTDEGKRPKLHLETKDLYREKAHAKRWN